MIKLKLQVSKYEACQREQGKDYSHFPGVSAKQDKEILDTLRSSGLAGMLKITQSKAAEMKSNFETQETRESPSFVFSEL